MADCQLYEVRGHMCPVYMCVQNAKLCFDPGCSLEVLQNTQQTNE